MQKDKEEGTNPQGEPMFDVHHRRGGTCSPGKAVFRPAWELRQGILFMYANVLIEGGLLLFEVFSSFVIGTLECTRAKLLV